MKFNFYISKNNKTHLFVFDIMNSNFNIVKDKIMSSICKTNKKFNIFDSFMFVDEKCDRVIDYYNELHSDVLIPPRPLLVRSHHTYCIDDLEKIEEVLNSVFWTFSVINVNYLNIWKFKYKSFLRNFNFFKKMLIIEINENLNYGNTNIIKYRNVNEEMWYYMFIDIETLNLLLTNYGILSCMKIPTMFTNIDNPKTGKEIELKYCGADVKIYIQSKCVNFSVLSFMEQNYWNLFAK